MFSPEELGLSRLPIREALSKLERDGLVEIFPARGAQVRRLSASNIESLYQAREALEGMAARLAAMRIPSGEFDRLRQQFQAVSIR
jgi:DNA-binding GntR family transcriptional regulator